LETSKIKAYIEAITALSFLYILSIVNVLRILLVQGKAGESLTDVWSWCLESTRIFVLFDRFLLLMQHLFVWATKQRMTRPFGSRAGFIVTIAVFRAPWRLLVLRRCLSSFLRGPRAIESRFATFIV
jgi:hypothetical protein